MFQLKKTTFLIEGRIQHINSQLLYTLSIDGCEVDLEKSLAVRLHSPDGFSWGYSGSGPAQSALAICLALFENRYVAQRLYQRFKAQFVAHWPQDQSFTQQIDLMDFLIDFRAQLRNLHNQPLSLNAEWFVVLGAPQGIPQIL